MRVLGMTGMKQDRAPTALMSRPFKEIPACAENAEGPVAKHCAAKQEALTAWLEENPLRRWRLGQPPKGRNRSVLARQLGVAHTAVGTWETGKRLPLIDAFAKIETLTGIYAQVWMEWYRQRPEGGRP